ncbi:hypothetical protein [Neptunomonas phycophila]|mgnify:CR=1 FL=1|uniref:hypothetical protein n=1 Tax=Neptunomonas phycophila TaxID=1572645 RepID=UPI0030FB2B3F
MDDTDLKDDWRQYYFQRLTIALDDLLHCEKYISKFIEISKTNDDVLLEALYVAIVATYDRVFNTSKTASHTDHHVKVCDRFSRVVNGSIKSKSGELEKLHERLRVIRDKEVAHSDGTERAYNLISNGKVPFGRKTLVPFDVNEAKQLLEIVQDLIIVIGTKQSEIRGAIDSEYWDSQNG